MYTKDREMKCSGTTTKISKKKLSPKNRNDLGWPVILHLSKKLRNKGKCHYPASVSSSLKK